MRSSDRTGRPSRRILYLITSDISARFLRGQLAFLIDRGFEVHVGVRRSEPSTEFDAGVIVHDLPFVREPSPVADLRALAATIRLIRSLRPVIVNASTPKAGLLGMLAARACRVRQRILVVRGLRFETMTGRRRAVFRWIERAAAKCATDVIFNSRSLRAVAEQDGIVPAGTGIVLAGGSGNGIDIDMFAQIPSRELARSSLGLSDDAMVIGFVGRLTKDKGIVDLVEAFEATEGAVLVLVGDFEPGDPVPDRVRKAIAARNDILHVPWVDDTRAVYPAMDVLAFPSYREGLPNVPLEAQLCGVPVIAYAATGTVDAVAPSNRLVPVGSVEALTSALNGRAWHDDSGQPATWVREHFDSEQVWNALLSNLMPSDT